jgi:hypothetical protein
VSSPISVVPFEAKKNELALGKSGLGQLLHLGRIMNAGLDNLKRFCIFKDILKSNEWPSILFLKSDAVSEN